jgi:succinate dehydrogenase/fumarate reductase flavoprotein subunit
MIAITTLDTDVLVIGGGLAGARTALETHAAGLKTLVVVKGLLGKSGSSIFAGNLDFFAAPEHEGQPDPAQLEAERQEAIRRTMEFLAKYTHYLGDQEYMLAASEYHQTDFFPWIEQRGYYVLRDEHGAVVTDYPHRTQAWGVQMGLSGTVLMDLMRKLVLSAQIQLMEQTAVTRLLKKDGQVTGVVALDFLHGQLYVIRAKAVVLATGHSNFIFRRATGTREGSASGWVMAYEAGASLQNIEMQWYHVSDVAYPATWMRLHLYPNPLPGTTHRSRLYNQDGELFFDGNWFPDNPVPYIMQLKHLVKQVVAGKARWDGGYYSSYEHVEPQVLQKYIYQTHFLEKIGIDLKTQMMENGVTWHMNVGGIRVDGKTMESGVPGLLVAGSVSALVTGGLPNVMYDGIVAARSAVERARSLTRYPELDQAHVEAEVQRVTGLFRTQPLDGLLPGQIKHKIRELAWEHLNYLKTESSLQAALEELHRIEVEDLPRTRLQTDTRQFNYDWQDALDAIDMLQALKLLTQFSLHRKESRGGFYRQDYPITDNQRWLVHIVGTRQEDGDLQLREFPVELPYAVPAQTVADYFDLDY